MNKKFIKVLIISLVILLIIGVVAIIYFNSGDKIARKYLNGKKEMTFEVQTHNCKPLVYYHQDTGNLVGFDVELATLICEELGMDASFAIYNWSDKVTYLDDYTIDAVMSGFVRDEEMFESQLDYTNSYLRVESILIVRKDKADIYTDADAIINLNSDGKLTVTSQKMSPSENAVYEDRALDGCVYGSQASYEDVFEQVSIGNVDFGVVSVSAYNKYASTYTNVVAVEGYELKSAEYAIGLRNNSPEMVERVNEILDMFATDGTLDRLAEQYEIKEQLIIGK